MVMSHLVSLHQETSKLQLVFEAARTSCTLFDLRLSVH